MLVLDTRGLKALAVLKRDSLLIHSHTVTSSRHLPAWLEAFANSIGGRAELARNINVIGVSIAPGSIRSMQASIDFANVRA